MVGLGGDFWRSYRWMIVDLIECRSDTLRVVGTTTSQKFRVFDAVRG